MASTDQTVRVFISSTFRDMNAERDHLVTVVFPELRERVEWLGLEFFDVDLRWGVPAKDANGETANSWEYCRQWIDRVEPFFVCMLGQRYGWEPEAEQLKDPADRQRQQDCRRSITDMEVRHGVLETNLRRRSYFYLRAGEAPASASDYVDPSALLVKLEQLKNEIRSCGRPVRSYPCRWTGEGFAEMEQFGRLVLDDLWSGVLRDQRFVSKEIWRQALGADPDTDPLYTDESQPVPSELWKKIVALAKPEPKNPLDAEREQMDAFATSRLRWFHGRTHEIQQLNEFINTSADDAPRLAVVAAVPGQGKSALLAKLHQQLQNPPHFVIAHFVGATERSASAHALVQRLLDELDRGGIAWPTEQQEGQEPKRDFSTLCLRLAMRLGDYAGERRVVILLDALNQLSDGLDLQWLPYRLGPSVRMIVSCVEDASKNADSPEQRVLRALNARRPAPLRVPLGPLTEADVRTIVVAYLEEYCKVLDTAQVDAICALPQARNPLYLLVMLGELRTMGGNDMNRIVGELIASMPQDHPDTVSLFRWVLQRLEVFGEEAVQWWCLYLAYGRIGMSSQELAGLLARKLGSDAAATALLIERGLRRYLLRRGPQFDFFHGQLWQAVFEQYGSQVEPANVHSDIATYFRDLADPQRSQSWKGGGPRPFLEIVFHLARAERLDELYATLCDLRFVEARCRHRQVFELIADYQLAQEHLPEAQEELRKERARQARLDRWTEEIVAYSHQWSERRDRIARGEVVSEPEPHLPPPPATCRLGTGEVIEAECKRIIEYPTELDRIKAFGGFVQQECYPLIEFGTRPGFVVQHAFNHAPRGPVHEAAAPVLPAVSGPLLMRHWFAKDEYNPRPTLLKTLDGHTSFVMSVSVTQDGRRAVSGSADQTVQVWDLETGSCLRVLKGHAGAVNSVSVTADGSCAVSGSGTKPGDDNTVRVWGLEEGVCLRVLEGHTDAVFAVCVTPDGRYAVSGSWDRTLRVWDLKMGACLHVLKGHLSSVWSVSVTPDGRRAVSGSVDKTLRVWDLETGACLQVLKGHTGGVKAVAVTPDGRCAVSASRDETLRVWNLETASCSRVLEGHKKETVSISVTPDGQYAVSAGLGFLRVWDLETGECKSILEGHLPAASVAVIPGGRYAISASYDSTLRLWNLNARPVVRAIGSHADEVRSVSLSPDGLRAITGSRDKTLRVWDVETGTCLRMLEGHTGMVTSVCFTPDGRRAVSASIDKTLRVWDLETTASPRVFEGHKYGVRKVVLTPDGRRAVSASQDKTLRVWEIETGTCLRVFEGHTDSIDGVCIMPDGLHVISASWDKTLRVWDLETGACLRVLDGYKGWVGNVIVIPNSRRVISTGYGGKVRVWDIDSGSCVHVFDGHKATEWSMDMTKDGQHLITTGMDRTLRIFDLETGASVAVEHLPSGASAVATSSELGRMVLGTPDGDIIQFESCDVAGSSAITDDPASVLP
jgi:WD40 repeat protein